ncbi:MAG: phage head morphogenesis protein, partial [Betaproteobacteria bacterium]|nr:phage head morphogenesis protein [Betaproteobacteria bacterium]
VVYWVLASYRAHPPVIAMDEAPIRSFQRMFRKVRNRWLRNFDTLAEKMAIYFATSASDRVDGALSSMLREHDFAVKFKTTQAQREAVQATLAENVGLIKSIPERYLGDVEGLVMRSFQAGRDIGFLSKALQQNYGVTKRRAALIARSQNNMATATFTRIRQSELGITKAKWLHSAGGKTPRPEHVAMSGKLYDVEKGAYLEGVWTWPGREINCRCVSVPVIEGFIE